MQIFIPYKSPLLVAKCLDSKRLRKQIIECNQILRAISGESKAWANHPVTKMYSSFSGWVRNYKDCLDNFLKGNITKAEYLNTLCITPGNYPWFLDITELLDQHKKRLFTKNKLHYELFSNYGTSDENWYVINKNILVYVNGKIDHIIQL